MRASAPALDRQAYLPRTWHPPGLGQASSLCLAGLEHDGAGEGGPTTCPNPERIQEQAVAQGLTSWPEEGAAEQPVAADKGRLELVHTLLSADSPAASGFGLRGAREGRPLAAEPGCYAHVAAWREAAMLTWRSDEAPLPDAVLTAAELILSVRLPEPYRSLVQRSKCLVKRK